jgi:hypothetical protein
LRCLSLSLPSSTIVITGGIWLPGLIHTHTHTHTQTHTPRERAREREREKQRETGRQTRGHTGRQSGRRRWHKHDVGCWCQSIYNGSEFAVTNLHPHTPTHPNTHRRTGVVKKIVYFHWLLIFYKFPFNVKK